VLSVETCTLPVAGLKPVVCHGSKNCVEPVVSGHGSSAEYEKTDRGNRKHGPTESR
jgi:hypothetical protein